MLRITNCYVKSNQILSHKRVLLPNCFGHVFNPVVCFASPCDTSKRTNDCSCDAGGSKGKHRITFKPYVAVCYTDHDYKNMGLKRPMSPHLAIFKMTVPATMSIIQRATGVLLAVYALGLAGGSLFLPNGVETYVSVIQSLNLGSTCIFLFKILLGFPFLYHYFNGIRFCIWNMGRGLEIKQVSATASQAMVGAAVCTFIFAFI